MRKFLLAMTLVAAAPLWAESGEGHADNTIYWKWANFAILAGLIGYAIARNAPAMFRARTEEIQKDLHEASRRRQQAEARTAEIERRLADLGGELETMRGHARQEMEAEAQRMRTESARLLAKVESAAAQEIEALTKQSRRSLREHSARLALTLAEQKIRARVGAAEDEMLIGAFVEQVGRTGARLQ